MNTEGQERFKGISNMSCCEFFIEIENWFSL